MFSLRKQRQMNKNKKKEQTHKHPFVLKSRTSK